jgi:hypothetical protein
MKRSRKRGLKFGEGPVWPRLVLVVCLLIALSPAACKKSDTAQQVEIRTAIENYLKTRPGLAWDQMTMEFNRVEVRGDTAEADVTFKTKAGEGMMGFHYSLRREGGKWTVVSGRGGMGMPGGHPPVGTSGSPSEQPTVPQPQRSH